MNEDKFKKTDEQLSELMKKYPRTRVPDDVLKNFSFSVTHEIRERQNRKSPSYQRSSVFRPKVLVPVFAAAVLFFTVLSRVPVSHTDPLMRPLMLQSASEISEEISALKTMGAWNDDDEKTVVPVENVIDEIEKA